MGMDSDPQKKDVVTSLPLSLIMQKVGKFAVKMVMYSMRMSASWPRWYLGRLNRMRSESLHLFRIILFSFSAVSNFNGVEVELDWNSFGA